MVRVYGDVLLDFEVVDAPQDGQAMAEAVDSHFFELVVVDGDEGLAIDFFVWVEVLLA